MRVYTYRPEEVAHLMQTGPIGLRFAGATAVDSPAEADVIASPVPLLDLPDRAAMERLPHFAQYEDRHVFLDISDCKHTYAGTRALLIRCDLTQSLRRVDPRSLAWMWPTEDWAQIGDTLSLPLGGCPFDATFHGWLSTDTRSNAVKSCTAVLGSRFDSSGYMGFFGHQTAAEMSRRRSCYATSLRRSRLAICPESDPGVIPYRFFEALAAARPPLLFSTGYVLPWDDEIPWHDIAFLFESRDALRAGEIVAHILRTYSDAELQARGRLGREWWQQRIAGTEWDRLFTLAVEREFGLRHA